MSDFTSDQVSFLLNKAVKGLRPDDALSLNSDDAYEAFKEIRWGWTDGKGSCAHCGHTRLYEYASPRGKFKCASCGRQFSVSSKTPFHAQKTGHKVIVSALAFKVHEPLTIVDLSSRLGINYRTGWRLNSIFKLIRSNLRPVRSARPIYWPYRAPTGNGGDMVAAINAALPRNIPEDVRADVAQEIILGVLEGEITMEQVALEAAKYLRKFRRAYEWDPKAFSWDQNVPGTDRLSWDEVTAAPEIDTEDEEYEA